MEFEEIVTVRQIKRILHDPSAHVEQRYGTAKEAIEYCKKDNKFMEFGKPKAQGERTDLADVYESLKVGRSLLDIIEDTPERTYVILGESNVSKICSDGKCKNLKRGSNPLLLSTSDDPEPESPIITTMTPTIKRRDTSSQCNSPEKCTSTDTMESQLSGSTSLGIRTAFWSIPSTLRQVGDESGNEGIFHMYHQPPKDTYLNNHVS